jgi:hypothetical protein
MRLRRWPAGGDDPGGEALKRLALLTATCGRGLVTKRALALYMRRWLSPTRGSRGELRQALSFLAVV